MTKNITVQDVRDALERAVNEKGEDYVYPGAESGACWYAEYRDAPPDLRGAFSQPTAPSCIVGHVLYYLGWELTEFPGWEGTNVYGLGSALIDFGIPQEVIPGLTRAQDAQDAGETWGEALKQYDERMSLGDEGEDADAV